MTREILGHGRILESLRRAAEADRLPHALLFTGPRGIGKRTVALELARELVAGSDPSERSRFDRGAQERFALFADLEVPFAVRRRDLVHDARAGESSDPGGPDEAGDSDVAGETGEAGEAGEESLLQAYAVLEREGWITGVSSARGGDVVDLLVRNPERFTGRKGIPFAHVVERELGTLERVKDAHPGVVAVARRLFAMGPSNVLYRRSLGIELVNGKGDGDYFRNVRAFLGSAVAGGRRVAIFDDAEKMTDAAENAFLKTLEEPPPGTLLVLVTSEPLSLLPTTVSRCARIVFDAIAPAELVRFLVEAQGLEPADAAFAARLSDGSVRRALELRDLDVGARRRFLDVLLPELAAGDLRALLERTGEQLGGLEGQGKRDGERAAARVFLELLSLVLRDLVLANVAPGADSLTGVDRERLTEIARRRPTEDWERLFERTEVALLDVDSNVEPRLAVEALFAQALPAA